MSPYRREDDWWDVLFYVVVAAILIFGLWACQKGDKEKCEARGGVWLTREQACVAGPDKPLR